MISERARAWRQHDPLLVRAHFVCAEDPFYPDDNPNGYVNFGTAENQLLFDLVDPLLRESQEVSERDTHYNKLHGADFLRQAIAVFLSRRAGRELSPDSIAVASGASAILEILSFVLCDAGESILIPTPYYSGFDHTLALRSEATLHYVPLQSPVFKVTVADIEKAYSEATSSGVSAKAILLNSPQNPLGQVYSETLIRDTIAFVQEKKLHLVLDEIYAESLMPGVSHFSGLTLQSDLVHVVYGFAKDFGLSGYKVGILHSENEEVIEAAQDNAYFYAVSMQTQRTLANLLDNTLREEFLEEMRRRLAQAYEHTVGELAKHTIPFLPVEGGIVMWLDLRRFLASVSFNAERELYQRVFEECRVSLPPGRAFHCIEPGWFRLCFTIPESHRTEGLSRLLDYL